MLQNERLLARVGFDIWQRTDLRLSYPCTGTPVPLYRYTRVRTACSGLSQAERLTPRSPIFTTPSPKRKKLSGFRSRWTMSSQSLRRLWTPHPLQPARAPRLIVIADGVFHFRSARRLSSTQPLATLGTTRAMSSKCKRWTGLSKTEKYIFNTESSRNMLHCSFFKIFLYAAILSAVFRHLSAVSRPAECLRM